MQLSLANINYSYPSAAESALHEVNATFSNGWCGIVGDNGSGKTTLVLIACGLIKPDTGVVSPGLYASYCAQDASEAPANLNDFVYAFDGEAIRLRADLAIEDEWFWRYETLSSGQQKRIQVACALWSNPDLLAMDEPTNHLDASTKRSIAKALKRYKGIGLLVSHDRELLDSLCTQCLFMKDGSAIMRPGTYSQASSQATLEHSSALHAKQIARKEKTRIEREAQRRREEASRTAGRRSLKGVDKHDSDARDKRNLAVVSGQDGKAGRLSSRMESKLAGAEARLNATFVEKRYDADVWFDAQPSRRKVLLRLEPQELTLGEYKIELPALYIGNCDHIGLIGDNGTGKSTLVRFIIEHLYEHTKYLYIPQEASQNERQSTVKRLNELTNEERGRVLSCVAQLNSDPDRVLDGAEISPGEMRKLMLAMGILSKPELIVMDEPSNHLDLGSTEALERMLAEYPGALLLVSHDATLVSTATQIIWETSETERGYKLVIR